MRTAAYLKVAIGVEWVLSRFEQALDFMGIPWRFLRRTFWATEVAHERLFLIYRESNVQRMDYWCLVTVY